MITILIFLVLHIYIGSSRLLKNGAFNAKFDVDKRLHLMFIGLDWDKNDKIEEAIATYEDNQDKKEDFWEKNR